MNRKLVKIYGIQIICVIFVLMSGGFFLKGLINHPGYDSHCEEFRGGWRVQSEGEEQEYEELPEYLSGKQTQEVVLSRTVEGKDIIGLFAFQQQVYAYLDGEEILRFVPDSSINSKTPGNGWQFVELDEGDAGKTLSIRIVECYGSGRVVIPALYHGTKDGITLFYLKKKIPMLLVSILGVTVGLILLMIWGISGKKLQLGEGLPWLALFSVFIGTWSAIELNIYSFFFQRLLLISWLSYICLKMAVMPFIQFVNITFHDGKSKMLKILTFVSIAEFWITGILQFLGVADYADTVFLTHGVLIIASIYVIVTAIPKLLQKDERDSMSDQWRTYVIHSIFIVVVAIMALMDLFGYYFTNNPDVANYSRWGYFSYIMAVTIALLFDFIELVIMGKQAAIIKREASLDVMTQFFNRMEFEKDISRLPGKIGGRTGIVMFDLNNLKQVNDTCGHEAGDYYIIIGSQVIRAIFSKWGRLYRIGGDEFCCVAKNLTESDYRQEREMLERKMKEMHVPGYDLAMAAAAGYALFEPDEDKTLRDTMKRADALMYQRKKELKAERKEREKGKKEERKGEEEGRQEGKQ